MRRLPFVLLLALLAACSGTAKPDGDPMTKASLAPPTELTAPVFYTDANHANSVCQANLDAAKAYRQSILDCTAPRSVENTLTPYNNLLVMLDRTLGTSDFMANVHVDPAVREAAEACQREAMKLVSELKLDRGLYDAVAAIDATSLNGELARFHHLLMRDYHQAGVDKDETTRQRLAQINEELVANGQDYSRNIRDDRRSIRVAPERLAGLPEDFVAGHPVEEDGMVVITTDYPDLFPVLTYAQDESLRRELQLTFDGRAYPANVDVLKKILQLRHEYATLLGYANWADYFAADKMAKDGKTIGDFIDRVASIARPRMQNDLEQMLARKQKDLPDATVIEAWDRLYYTETMKKELFGVDAQALRPYFEFNRVKEGILALNAELFGVKFVKVDEPLFHPDVEAYDVLEGDKVIARFYLDMFPRDGKYGHAAMFPLLSGVNGSQLAAGALLTNFPKPSAEVPALLELDQVSTFLHEFGHLMHQLLSGRHQWVMVSGIACEWDFVEVPSQLLEEWTWDHPTMSRFALHYQTNEPLPADLLATTKAAQEFGKGLFTMRQLFLAGLSLRYHQVDPSNIDVRQVLLEVLDKYSPFPYPDESHLYANFGHLEGYSSAYYTYMWSLALAKDMYTRFEAEGMLNLETAAEYRKAVLEAGGAVDAKVMVENFLGRPSSFDAFQKWLEN
ncbi:MAG: M3 family metallopeptidase [Myxococcota bacterium]|jgi:thimet oligopeptidase|nr:M3 family metallopeptidase [Myxococcota bacterium]